MDRGLINRQNVGDSKTAIFALRCVKSANDYPIPCTATAARDDSNHNEEQRTEKNDLHSFRLTLWIKYFHLLLHTSNPSSSIAPKAKAAARVRRRAVGV